MLLFDSLTKKPAKNISAEENPMDISVPVVNFEGYVTFGRTVMVSSEMEMRPDTISGISLGNQDKMDYLLKYNNVDNPFSVGAGDVLALPEDWQMTPKKPVSEKDGQEDIRDKANSRASKTDKKRIEFVKKMAEKDPNGTKLVSTPNLAPKGSQEMTSSGGVTTFGADVTASNDSACEPKSKAELKQKLLQKKIFKG
jgi:hypothetical protein